MRFAVHESQPLKRIFWRMKTINYSYLLQCIYTSVTEYASYDCFTSKFTSNVWSFCVVPWADTSKQLVGHPVSIIWFPWRASDIHIFWPQVLVFPSLSIMFSWGKHYLEEIQGLVWYVRLCDYRSAIIISNLFYLGDGIK